MKLAILLAVMLLAPASLKQGGYWDPIGGGLSGPGVPGLDDDDDPTPFSNCEGTVCSGRLICWAEGCNHQGQALPCTVMDAIFTPYGIGSRCQCDALSACCAIVMIPGTEIVTTVGSCSDRCGTGTCTIHYTETYGFSASCQ
jgi:hypothetical protein